MVLDFLPYKVPAQPRKNLGWIRYITFAMSLIFVAALFLAHVGNIELFCSGEGEVRQGKMHLLREVQESMPDGCRCYR